MLLEELEPAVAERTPAGPPPNVGMLQMLFGKHISYSLSAVARLGVADYLQDGPVPVETLANKVEAHGDSLYRVMRLLAGVGVFEELPGGMFALRPMGRLLCTNVTGSLRYLAIQIGDPWSVRAWEYFPQTMKTGVDSVTLAFGKNVFEVFAEEPEQAEHFNRSMSGISGGFAEAIAKAYDFNSIYTLADVGGGQGALLAAILEKNPHLQGVVYDLPDVVAGAASQPHFARCGGRMHTEAGSFFERVPAGCDAYMMKFILHDWSDEHCRRILKCIREQMFEGGRVLVLEQVVGDVGVMTPALLIDIEMLLATGGRERTEGEFAALFASAGLRLNRVIPTESPLCILEAVVA